MPDSDEDLSLKGEAEAQSEETIMPWLWGGLGVAVVVLFVVWIVSGGDLHRLREPPAQPGPHRAQGY